MRALEVLVFACLLRNMRRYGDRMIHISHSMTRTGGTPRMVLLYRLIIFGLGFGLSACTQVAGTMGAAVAEFSKSLVSTSNENYNGGYSSEISDLMLALAYKELGVNQPPNSGSYAGPGYKDPNYDPYQSQGGYQQTYPGEPGYVDPYQTQGGNQQAYPQSDPNQGSPDPYQSQGGNQQAYPQGDPNQGATDPYQSQTGYNDPYQAQGGNQQTYPQGDPNQGATDPYQSQPGYTDPYQAQAGSQKIHMNVALLAQRPRSDGTYGLELIQDGAVLRDGRGNPAAGDKLKVMFSVNCDCYVYIIGIDATGYSAQIFPDASSGSNNPVQAGRQYLLPEGGDWWGLDEYRGTESIYFVTSYRQRTDIENIIANLANQPRNLSGGYQPVTQAAMVPIPRGLIKVQDGAPTLVPTGYGTPYQITPQKFIATAAGADLIITRWFNHQ
jgi:hypothetical protein